jgi:hypothetical protein
VKTLVSIALGLVLTVHATASSEGRKEISRASDNANVPSSDSRGTEASPLIVDTRRIQSKEEAVEEASKNAEQKHVNAWVIGLTFGLMICAVLQALGIGAQVWVYLVQTKLMRATLVEISNQAKIMAIQVQDARDANVASSDTTTATLKSLEAQAQSLRYQTTHLKNSAKAALLNAKAVINAERPWIFVSVERMAHDRDYFMPHVENKGRTPALILEGSIGFAVVKSFNELPSSAPYSNDTLVSDRMLLPGETALLFGFDRMSLRTRFGSSFPTQERDGMILVIGKIIYRDLLNNDTKAVHETRWIYWFRPGETGDDQIRPVKGVGLPTEYERYT